MNAMFPPAVTTMRRSGPMCTAFSVASLAVMAAMSAGTPTTGWYL